MTQTDLKHCPRCERDLPRSEFGPSKQTADGLFRWCRDCKRAADRRSHEKHRPERTRKMRDRYHANPEPQRERAREWARAHPEENRARAAAWNVANRDQRNGNSRRSARARYAADYGETKREQWRRREAVIRQGCELYPFTLVQLAGKLDYWGGLCRWCRTAEADCWDHVKPLARRGPHMLANLAPACTGCNSAKRDVWPLSAVVALMARLRELRMIGI